MADLSFTCFPAGTSNPREVYRNSIRHKERLGMRALVTGSAGFLGSHMVDALLGNGHHVIGVDNLLTGNPRNMAHLSNEPRFEFINQDITIPFDPGQVDLLFNMASPASPVDYANYGIETLMVGSVGVRNVLDIARKYDARFLHCSTS